MSREALQAARLIERLLRNSRGRLGWRATVALSAVVLALYWWGVQPPVPAPGDAPTANPHASSRADDGGGLLREIGRERYESPAGLVYTRGSRHGHRLDHVLAHCRDEPGRPGSHGVFDADSQDDVVRLIDEAYEKALAGDDARSKPDGGRTIHTVNLRRRIGYVGGKAGAARGHPAATRMRLVVEGDRLITAYPMGP